MSGDTKRYPVADALELLRMLGNNCPAPHLVDQTIDWLVERYNETWREGAEYGRCLGEYQTADDVMAPY
jgi:hypothetical protein